MKETRIIVSEQYQAREDLRLLSINARAIDMMAKHALEKQELDITTHNALEGLYNQMKQIMISLMDVTTNTSLKV